jgi:hypothetical protein
MPTAAIERVLEAFRDLLLYWRQEKPNRPQQLSAPNAQSGPPGERGEELKWLERGEQFLRDAIREQGTRVAAYAEQQGIQVGPLEDFLHTWDPAYLAEVFRLIDCVRDRANQAGDDPGSGIESQPEIHATSNDNATDLPVGGSPPFDPLTQAILARATTREQEAALAQRRWEEFQARFRRAVEAWDRVCSFRGRGIPCNLKGEELHLAYARLLVELGRVLKADGWQALVNEVKPGSDAKAYAVTVLKRAMDGDTETVTAMVREAASKLFSLGLEVDGWLREGLMYEVLNIQRAPEPPEGWEGAYLEPVKSEEDFIKWVDQQFLIQELGDKAQNGKPSNGRLVRNAFRLVSKLEMTGMPMEPIGPFTINDELAVLRNLRRQCRTRRRHQLRATFRLPPQRLIRVASDVPDLGKADTLPEFWDWCNRWRAGLKQLRVCLGEPPPASVAADEFRLIPEVVLQCRNYLRGFGAEDIPERFAFPGLPLEQTPTGPEHFPSPMEGFLAWASGYRAPGHGILKLIGEVEEFLTWAMAWAKRHTDVVPPSPTGESTAADASRPAVPDLRETFPEGLGAPGDQGGVSQDERADAGLQQEETRQTASTPAHALVPSAPSAIVSAPGAAGPPRALKEPTPDAITVYRYWFLTGKNQTDLANDPDLMAKLGRQVNQGTISRWLSSVKEWIAAGNVLPPLPEVRGAKPLPIDPERIDLGKRSDGRAKRQRPGRQSDSDE